MVGVRQADRRSPEFRKYFCDVAVRSLVAMCPRRASTRTTGVIGMQIWIDHARPGAQVDRLLNGPTHDAWLTPWRPTSSGLGVRFEFGARATRLHLRDGRITGVRRGDARGHARHRRPTTTSRPSRWSAWARSSATR